MWLKWFANCNKFACKSCIRNGCNFTVHSGSFEWLRWKAWWTRSIFSRQCRKTLCIKSNCSASIHCPRLSRWQPRRFTGPLKSRQSWLLTPVRSRQNYGFHFGRYQMVFEWSNASDGCLAEVMVHCDVIAKEPGRLGCPSPLYKPWGHHFT